MPPNLTFPGVYIEEAESAVHPIVAVATSITAFVGRALRGPVDEAVTITSLGDFQRIFGGVWLESNLGYAVQDFYRNGGSTAIIVRVHKTVANDTATLTFGSGTDEIILDAASPGAWGSKLSAVIDNEVSDPSDTTLFNLTVTDAGTKTVETFRNVSYAAASPRRYDHVLEGQSNLVRANPTLPTTPLSPFPATATVTGGADGDPVDATVFTGGTLQADKHGLYALETADLVNIIVIPPYTSTGEIDASVMTDTIAYALVRRAIMILDPPAAWTSLAGAVGDAPALAASPNATVYFPHVLEADPLRAGQLVTVAPSGSIAGVMARTDAARGVWKAPAGLEATVAGAQGMSIPLTDLEIGELNPLGVNCLRSSPGAGITVWGARTRNGNDRLADQWKYLPVRRTALFIEESLYRGTQWVVFEPNDAALWAAIRLNVGAFMSTLFRQGAFAGTTPREAFFVKCDAETTTPADVDNGIVNIVVGFAPLKPAEFVVIVLEQMAGQTGS
ncbi:MAG TPA: phage tail sheath C-terminal domain-containing protein [Solirubrobacteraceae bacterium]|nr:phage tail sheath C-terminal domain-containing protein [Solirubrobacteraceae bacterium]